jgi:hypothetical protein
MRIIPLAASLFLGLSLTTGSMAAVAPAGSAVPTLAATEPVSPISAAKPRKSKKLRSRLASSGKIGPALAHRSAEPLIPDDGSLADRSTEAHGQVSERIYDGLLPGEGYSVAYPIYANRQGRTECVELIKGLLGAPSTSLWREGRRLKPNADRIEPGTAIATFVNGRYPSHQGRRGSKHAAIFLRASEAGIYVLDQFAHQKTARERFIPWHHPSDRRAANNASSYSTVRW